MKEDLIIYHFLLSDDNAMIVCQQGERAKFDRFVDVNERGAQRRVYSDLRIYTLNFHVLICFNLWRIRDAHWTACIIIFCRSVQTATTAQIF